MPLVYAGTERVEPLRDSAHEWARKIDPEFAKGDLVRVAGGRNQAEAELIQNLLIEEGIPSILRRSAGFDVPDMLAAGPRDVLVPQSGGEAALDVLREEGLGPQEAPYRPPRRRDPLILLAAIVACALVAALLAWLLVQGADPGLAARYRAWGQHGAAAIEGIRDPAPARAGRGRAPWQRLQGG